MLVRPCSPWKLPGKNPSFPLTGFVVSMSFLVSLWLHNSNLCLHLPWLSSLCVLQISLILNIPATGFRAHLNPVWLYRNVITWLSAKTLFPNQIMFTGTRGHHFNISLWRNTIQPTTDSSRSRGIWGCGQCPKMENSFQREFPQPVWDPSCFISHQAELTIHRQVQKYHLVLTFSICSTDSCSTNFENV